MRNENAPGNFSLPKFSALICRISKTFYCFKLLFVRAIDVITFFYLNYDSNRNQDSQVSAKARDHTLNSPFDRSALRLVEIWLVNSDQIWTIAVHHSFVAKSDSNLKRHQPERVDDRMRRDLEADCQSDWYRTDKISRQCAVVLMCQSVAERTW